MVIFRMIIYTVVAGYIPMRTLLHMYTRAAQKGLTNVQANTGDRAVYQLYYSGYEK